MAAGRGGRPWRPAVAAEEAGTDGTIDVQCRSNDHDYRKTTVMPTDFVKVTEPTISRVSPVVSKEAHTDGTRAVQYQSDDQNYMKATIMQMPMDFLEIPEPSLPRGVLELAEKVRYADVGSGQSCYAEEVQSQEAGLTRPVLVTIMECSSSVLKEGAMIVPGISTESIPPIFSAGRHYPVDQSGLVGPWDKTEQSVCPDRMKKMMKPIPRAQCAQTSQLTKFSQWLKARWASISHIAQWAQTECFPRVIQINRWMKAQWASMSHETRWVRTECFPRVIPISQWLMAQWARRVYWAQWAPEGCSSSVNRISQWLLAQWASYLHPARWARVGWYLIMNRMIR